MQRDAAFPGSNRWRRMLRLVTAAALIVASTPSIYAINIIVHLDDEGMNPSFDADGSRLKTMADAAALYWENYLPEAGTYDIDMWWDSGLPSTTLGQWTFDHVGNDNIRIQPNPPSPWYFDPTPSNSDEFNFATQASSFQNNQWFFSSGQWLYRDLTATQRGDWFGGNPPALMEVGYRGRATSQAIQNQFDLFSTVIHEMGHELGVNDTGGPWEAEDSLWIRGKTIMFKENSAGDHLAARPALMCGGCGVLGTRRMPSATDIMAAAIDESMSTIDLPRKDFLDGVSWDHGPSWAGGMVPDVGDDAFIRNGDLVSLNATATAQTLFISEGSRLSTWAHQLNVPGRTDVVSVGPLQSYIDVMNGGQVMLKNLTLAGGLLDMNGGLATLLGPTVLTSNGSFTGEISGYGMVDVTTNGTLINDGLIKSDTLMGLIFNTFSPTSKFDLDGADGGPENGIVNARYGSITFNGEITDAFHGEMIIGVGKSITMSKDWTLDVGGRLELDGGSLEGSAAVLDSSNSVTTVKGSIIVHGVGKLATQETIFEASSATSLLNPNDRLIFASPTTFKGGTYDGHGGIEQQASVNVSKDTTIDAHEYDWGNSEVGHLRNTDVYKTFTINSATTGTPRNEYRGQIQVDGGTLAVNLEAGWLLPGRNQQTGELEGSLYLMPGKDLPKVTGVPLTVEGFVRASGGLALMEADFITSPSASVTVMVGAALHLKGHNTYNGGAFTGDGEIGQWGDTDVVSDTTIGTKNYDLDGEEGAGNVSTTTIHPGATMTINSERIDQPGQAFHGTVIIDSGDLAINTLSSWVLGEGGQLDLRRNSSPASVGGSPIMIDGHITTSGVNAMVSPVTFRESATVVATASGDALALNGHTNYEGGSYTGAGGIVQDADAFVNAPTTIDLGFIDLDGSKDAEDTFTELHDDLTLNVDRIDRNDNRFNGRLEVTDPAKFEVNTPTPWSMAGTMKVVGAPGTELTVAGAEVVVESDIYVNQQNTVEFLADVSGPGNFTGDGDVVFLGQYSPGNSPAIVSAAGNVRFGDTSGLLLEIGGAVAGSKHDQLRVAGDLSLDGTVVFRFTDGYAPQQSDSFFLFRVGGDWLNLLGDEDIVIQNLAPGFHYEIVYDRGGAIRLTALNDGVPLVYARGDTDKDGDVDDADLNILLSNWQAGTTWEQGNFDAPFGVTDQADLDDLLASFGVVYDPLSGGGLIAIPEPWSLLLICFGLFTLLPALPRRRRVLDTMSIRVPAPIPTCRRLRA